MHKKNYRTGSLLATQNYIRFSILQLVIMVFLATSCHIRAIQQGAMRKDLWFMQNSALCIT